MARNSTASRTVSEGADRVGIQGPLPVRERQGAALGNLYFLWQILGDLGLCPAQYLRFDDLPQLIDPGLVLVRLRLDGLAVALAKILQRAKKSRLDEIKQAPDVRERVLHGSPRAGNLESGVLLLRRPRDHRVWVLYLLGLVADHRRPSLRSQRKLKVAKRLVGGQDKVRPAKPVPAQKPGDAFARQLRVDGVLRQPL